MDTKIKFRFDDHQTKLLHQACLSQANASSDLLQSQMYLKMAVQFESETRKFQRQWARHLNKKYAIKEEKPALQS